MRAGMGVRIPNGAMRFFDECRTSDLECLRAHFRLASTIKLNSCEEWLPMKPQKGCASTFFCVRDYPTGRPQFMNGVR